MVNDYILFFCHDMKYDIDISIKQISILVLHDHVIDHRFFKFYPIEITYVNNEKIVKLYTYLF